MATKWGIVCAGNIANDFCSALELLSQDDHKIAAVASRHHDRAREFAERFGIQKSYGCYEDLAKDPDIDIAYVGAVTSEHFRLAKMMLNHGKHVLCEVPMTTDLESTAELIKIARNKKLFLMEGHWSMFFPVYDKVREELPSIGKVQFVDARFGVDGSAFERLQDPNLGGGGLYELGPFLIGLSTMLFGCRPEKIMCDGTLFPSGVDESGCLILRYSGGRFAQLSYHLACNYVNSAVITGPKGSIQIADPFWAPTKIKTPTEEHEFCLKEGKHQFIYPNSAGLVYEAEYVRKCLQKGNTECDLAPQEHSIIIAEVIDEVLRQLGVK